ncbi:unnamed protein product [Adineta steineri]|uniref:Saposin B-type domain-containing protein n=1 Tax=Adineta steineri TaxID=433720 RepID=A0A814IL61_9BILA|nr:unnamed protein product [Adineta steineri]
MYKVFTAILLVFIGVSSATRSFNTPSNNLQRLTSDNRDKNVGVDLCPTCIDEAVSAINVILNVILDEGILGTCGDLCGIVANKTSKFVGEVCDIACDAVGLDEFVRLIITVDLDPIWYCEMAKMCEIDNDVISTSINQLDLDDIRQKTIEYDQKQIRGIQFANAGTGNLTIINNHSVTSETCNII